MKTFLLFFLVLNILACNPDKEKIVDRNNPVFKTNDASRLFFKNVRQLFYDLEEKNEGKIQIFRMKDRSADSTIPVIQVDLINNWHEDRAYPMISLSGYFDDKESVEVQLEFADGTSELINFDKSGTMNDHFYFSSALYEAILRKAKIRLKDSQQMLFEDDDLRNDFRITMVDFYRLVSIY